MKELQLKQIAEMYSALLDQQQFELDTLDYSLVAAQIPHLEKLAQIGNSSISVFDACKRVHVFQSSNVGKLLGYDPRTWSDGDLQFPDSLIHPDDLYTLMQHALSVLKLFYNLPVEEKKNVKLVSAFRMKNASQQYVRVIEQQQVFELDQAGNLWLALSILDISPDQKNMEQGLQSELLNFKTGNIISFKTEPEDIGIHLTKRETEVLKLVREGLLSKEISDKLNISLHTVNTYRQRVLEKLGVSNSMEAVMLASRLGLT